MTDKHAFYTSSAPRWPLISPVAEYEEEAAFAAELLRTASVPVGDWSWEAEGRFGKRHGQCRPPRAGAEYGDLHVLIGLQRSEPRILITPNVRRLNKSILPIPMFDRQPTVGSRSTAHLQQYRALCIK